MQQNAAIEVGICVRQLDVMLEFYTEVLGCVEVRRSPIPAELSNQLLLASAGYLCVWLRTPFGERIKLMYPALPPTVADRPGQLTEHTGIAFLTFYCADLDNTLSAAEAAGARLRSDRALIDPERPVRLCFFEDPEGNVIELVQAEQPV